MKHKTSLSCLFLGILAFGLSGGASAGTTEQSITFGPAPRIIVGGSGTVSATASSGLPVTLTSTTPAVCTISGKTVTGVAAGQCMIAANQAGDAVYAAAPQVQMTFTVSQPSKVTCVDGRSWWVSNVPVVDGRRAYLRLNCDGCHGQTGAGGMGPALRDNYHVNDVTDKITNGDDSMPAFKNFLCPGDAANLTAYLNVISSSSAPRFLDWDKRFPSSNSGPFSDAALP